MPSHRSRLCAALVDVPQADYDREAEFWSAALARPAEREADNPEYTWYGEPAPGVQFMVQAVGEAAPRVHLDIETDDVEAEVARLEALGATVVARPKRWVIMRDPVGTIFCVVRVQLPEAFEASATTWST